MKPERVLSLFLVGAMSTWALAASSSAQTQPPTVQIPQPGTPQVMTMEGSFVRAAYNTEGYVILGYQLAQRSIGEEWIRLEMGTTLLSGVPDYSLKRDALSLETPDGKTIPMATIEEFRDVNLQAMENRAKVQRDSINYFPPEANRACRIGFFSELNSRAMPFDVVELSSRRACLGRVYFHVPGGIAYGQYWLNVKFEKSVVRVPFRILTKDEEKLLSKNFSSIKKQVDNAFKKKS